MFAGVLDEAVGEVGDADLLVGEGIDDEIGHSFIAFGFDGGGAVGEGLFHEGNDVSLGFVLVALGIFFRGRLLAQSRIGEEVIGVGGVEQLFGEGALGGRGLEVVFVFGKIFGHGDEFAADVVPVSSTAFEGLSAGFTAASFLASWAWAGKVRIATPTVRR